MSVVSVFLNVNNNMASENDLKFILCNRIKDSIHHTVGAQVAKCYSCEAEVWISQTSLDRMAGEPGGYNVICNMCLHHKQMTEKSMGLHNPATFYPIDSNQIRELEKSGIPKPDIEFITFMMGVMFGTGKAGQ